MTCFGNIRHCLGCSDEEVFDVAIVLAPKGTPHPIKTKRCKLYEDRIIELANQIIEDRKSA